MATKRKPERRDIEPYMDTILRACLRERKGSSLIDALARALAHYLAQQGALRSRATRIAPWKARIVQQMLTALGEMASIERKCWGTYRFPVPEGARAFTPISRLLQKMEKDSGQMLEFRIPALNILCALLDAWRPVTEEDVHEVLAWYVSAARLRRHMVHHVRRSINSAQRRTRAMKKKLPYALVKE